MEFPTMKQYLATFLNHCNKLVASLGGWLYILGVLLIIAFANVLNPLTKLVGTEIDKRQAWLAVLQKAFIKLLKVSSELWKGLLQKTQEADDYPETLSTAELRHMHVDQWLEAQGITDPEWRKRLIQAAVWQRRAFDLIEAWHAKKVS